MGSCVSRQANRVGRKSGPRKQRKDGNISRRKRKSLKRRVSSDRSSHDQKIQSLPVDRPFNNPAFQGSAEEAWFDSNTVMESDCSDEDFHSIPDDIHYATNLDATPTNSSACNSARNSISGAATSDSKVKSDGTKAVFADEISCLSGEDSVRNESLLDNCGILPSNCLPCLASTVPSIEKRKPLSSITADMRKKAALKLPFSGRKEGHHASSLFASKAVVIRPQAGSQVPRCPLGKKVPDTWSEIEPGTFRVRGVNYFRDKKKELAPNCAAYYPFGLDVFLSQRKINHIARFVELPCISSSGKLPPILVVNVQIPLYPATIFQGETDGEGISFAIYFNLSESFAEDLPSHFQENIRKLIDDEVERTKGFRTETSTPFRERLKILGRVVNVDDLPMSGPERKLMHAYNEKPVLSRPQHDFYLGDNYFEIDLDMHRFSYISRKGFETFLDRLKRCVLDFGLTIQGNRAEELPENVLCCVRLNEIDFSNYQQLGFSEGNLE